MRRNNSSTTILLGVLSAILIIALIGYFLLQAVGLVEGDKPNYNVNPNNNNLPGEQVPQKTYDGLEFNVDDLNLKSPSTLKKGHQVKYSIANNSVDAGTYEFIIDVLIYDENGTNVTSEYNIKSQKVKAIIQPKLIFYELLTDKIGVLTPSDYYIDNSLVSGHSLGVKKEKNELIPYVLDSRGIDVTKNYVLKPDPEMPEFGGGGGSGGSINKEKIKLKLKYKDYEKDYDGKPFKIEFEIVDRDLVGYNFEAEFITDNKENAKDVYLPVNTKYHISEKGLRITIEKDNKIVDVTDDFDITFVNDSGNLIIRKTNLDVGFDNFVKEYDNNDFNISDLKYTSLGLAKNDRLELALLNDVSTLKNVGVYDLLIQIKVINDKGVDVTIAYNIDSNIPKLTIKPIIYYLEFAQNSAEFKYLAQIINIDNSMLKVLDKNKVDVLDKDKILNEITINYRYLYNNKNYVSSIYNAGDYIVTIDSIIRFNENFVYIFNSTLNVKVTPVSLNFDFNNQTYTTIYQGKEIDFADMTSEYSLTGLLGNDMVKPKFSVESLNNKQNKLYNVGSYNVSYLGLDFINTSEANYECISYSSITVRINPYQLSFKSVVATYEYDGLAHEVPLPELTTNLLLNDHFNIFISKTLTDVSSYSFKVMNVYNEIVNGDGIDVTDNYDIFSNATGTLNIVKRKVTIESETKIFYKSKDKSFIANNIILNNVLDSDREQMLIRLNELITFIDFAKYNVGIYDNVIVLDKELLRNEFKNYDINFILGKVIIEE